jgi:hypothetical protein
MNGSPQQEQFAMETIWYRRGMADEGEKEGCGMWATKFICRVHTVHVALGLGRVVVAERMSD